MKPFRIALAASERTDVGLAVGSTQIVRRKYPLIVLKAFLDLDVKRCIQMCVIVPFLIQKLLILHTCLHYDSRDVQIVDLIDIWA